jgi:Mrp family chromosome partitioning ATPase
MRRRSLRPWQRDAVGVRGRAGREDCAEACSRDPMTRGHIGDMEDQTRTLRGLPNLVRPPQPTSRPLEQPLTLQPDVRVLSFTSGKGGVGKTHIEVNLAYALQLHGARVMI